MSKYRTEILREAADFVRHWDELNTLRDIAKARTDVLLDPIHFLASTDSARRSCSVACWREQRLIGVLYATEHYFRGLGSGYAIGGDFTGRGLLLCAPEDEACVLKEGVQRIVADGVHSLHLRFLPRDYTRPSLKGLKMKFLDAVIPGDRIALKPTFEEFLAGLGKHTRRNVRAYMRKTAEAGIEFVPLLTRDQYEAGVVRLNAGSSFPAESARLQRDERLLALHNGQRFGLRAADGTLVSVLCGFRRGDRFHLLTQLNDATHERLSLSLVLRGYTIGHLIETGHRELQFMGGSSLSFGRFCEPQAYRSIFIDKKRGAAAWAKQMGSSIVDMMIRMGRPIPEGLAILCNGFLEERSLSQRTALRPAAMLFQQNASRGL